VTGSTITGWDWDFGDGSPLDNNQNPTHTYAAVGTYNVSLTVTSADGCVSMPVVIAVNVIANPVANFTTNAVCEGLATQFTDASTAGTSTWVYDFGDGSPTSSLQNPSHSYALAGTYNTTLTVTMAGCLGTVTLPVTVNPLPQVSYTITPACPTTNVTVNNTSTIATGTIATWNWTMPSATPATSNAQTPAFSYATGGTYSVTLQAVSDQGCSTTLTQTVAIPFMPVPDFTFTSVCEGQANQFTDLSTVTGGTITGWTWVWGDGTPIGTTQNPPHTYAAAGTYSVTLIPTTNDGCTGPSVTYTVDVYTQPVASFTVSNQCQANAVTPVNTSTGANTYSWNFGDGSAANTNQNPSHNYAASGAYTITLDVATGNGCTSSATQTVNVFAMPAAAFTQTNVCDGSAMNFTDQTVGNVASWSWNFGDGNGSAQQSPSNLYNNAGTYNVTLNVVTTDGCPGSITQTVFVFPMPTIGFTPTDVCLGVATQFQNQSTVNPGFITGYNWNFGDGNTSTQPNPVHTYANAGIYNVVLSGTTDNGCTSTDTVTVTVHDLPAVTFTADITSSCSPLCVNFTDNSTVANSTITAWSWNFGDGTSSGTQNPAHCYTNTTFNTQQYSITLTVTSGFGCVSTQTIANMLSVYPNPVANFTLGPQPATILEPEITFVNTSLGGDLYQWDLGDGSTSTVINPVHSYNNEGTYMVTLITTTIHGCADTVQHEVVIDPELLIYVPNAFTPDGDGLNDIFIPSVEGVDEEDYDFMVFNRWGELIFQTDMVSKGWDGTHRGVKSKTDVYVWKIKAKEKSSGFAKEYIGHVNLLR
jgi:gliding motility-associated-like protein